MIITTEMYGWLAAIMAAMSYGTYGVPIKATKKLPVHPLVFQTYKTCTMFVCSWLVLAMPGVSFSFSKWGYLSGLLWVLGGTTGVIAVRYAGMAIAVGTWASVMICVNFVWGILIFNEPVANHTATSAAFVLLAIGLIGMSKYSESKKDPLGKVRDKQMSHSLQILADNHHQNQNQHQHHLDNIEENEDEENDDSTVVDHHTKLIAAPWGSFQNLSRVGHYFDQSSSFVQSITHASDKLCTITAATTTYGSTELATSTKEPSSDSSRTASTGMTSIERDDIDIELLDDDEIQDPENQRLYDEHQNTSSGQSSNSSCNVDNDDDYEDVTLWGQTWVISHRTIGICGAVANGILTGTSFIPVHYAKEFGFGGAHYMISYSIGALLSNTILWILYFVISMISCSSNDSTSTIISFRQRIATTYASLPRLFFKQMCLPGFMAGLLLTIAMFGTLIAVTTLGQGVGNSVIQAKILISGMWGIFYYKEINDRENIRKWFISASITVLGILWLSYERLEADKISHYYHHTPTHHHVLAAMHRQYASNTTTSIP